jgi:ATP-dependent DNA helicase RecQ
MLRTLGGEMFTEEKRFLPHAWARRLGMSVVALDEFLHILHMRGIIEYKPAMGTPAMRFLVHRHPITRNELSWHKYNFLIHQSKERLEALLSYAATPATQCRSQQLEAYFGETHTTPCGVCDFCRASKGTDVAALEEEVRQLLAARRMDFRGLVASMRTGSVAEREALVRDWMDRGLLRVEGGMFLHLAQKPNV